MDIYLAKNIVIFDEAHNIEKQVEEANSYQLSLQTLKKCEVYFQNMNELLRNDPDMKVKIRIDQPRNPKKPRVIDKKLADFESQQLEKPVLSLLKALNQKKEELETNFKEKLSKEEDQTPEKAKEIFQSTRLQARIGERIFDYFSNMKDSEDLSYFKNGIDQTNFCRFIEISRNQYSNKKQLSGSCFNVLATFSLRVRDLQAKYLDAKKKQIEFDYSKNYIRSYNLCFSLEVPEDFEGDLGNIPSYFKENFFNLKTELVCLNPGIGFADFNGYRPRSILLTSGTLTPLDSFESELMIRFPITLENAHVINPRLQCKTFIVFEGPSQKSFRFSRAGLLEHKKTPQKSDSIEDDFETRENQDMIQELGNSIIHIVEKIPNGVLICFSSYSLKDRCVKKWKNTLFEDTNLSIYDELNSIKRIYIEEKSKVKNDEIMEQYKKSAEKKKGASYFIICRGKVSEGIDFKGEMARAVILIGIPLPPWKDPLINAKMNFLNDKKVIYEEGISGDKWYNQEATRAFNQAIGRVIRDQKDYGLVFLFDDRYREMKFSEELPKWIIPNLTYPDTFQEILDEIPPFFHKLQKLFGNRSIEEFSSEDEILSQKPTSPIPRFKKASTVKRPGRDIARDKSELKKVLKTISRPMEGVDASVEQACDFTINNQTYPSQSQDIQSLFFPVPQSSIRLSDRAQDSFELPSTQEATNSNIMDPLPQFGRQTFETGNSMQSCGSLGFFCESCKMQRPLPDLDPSDDKKFICGYCWGDCG